MKLPAGSLIQRQFKVVYCCLVESGLLVVVSVVLDWVVVVSVVVPDVVCGVSQEAIAKPNSATNRMRFINLILKLKNNYCFTFNYSAKYYQYIHNAKHAFWLIVSTQFQ